MAGDYSVTRYEARTPGRVIATCAMEFGENGQILAYAVTDEEYENLIEEGTAENSIQVFDTSAELLRSLELASPVKQVMSCHHKVYLLLCNGALFKVTALPCVFVPCLTVSTSPGHQKSADEPSREE